MGHAVSCTLVYLARPGSQHHTAHNSYATSMAVTARAEDAEWQAVCRHFDFDRLREVTHSVCRNLNRIIDINYYPVETARRSNMRHRPIGIGVQVPPLPVSITDGAA